MFEYEKEIRAIVKIRKGFTNDLKIDYFVRDGYFIPCLEMEINKTAKYNVTIGPLLKSEFAKITVRSLFENNNLEKPCINNSKAPLRF